MHSCQKGSNGYNVLHTAIHNCNQSQRCTIDIFLIGKHSAWKSGEWPGKQRAEEGWKAQLSGKQWDDLRWQWGDIWVIWDGNMGGGCGETGVGLGPLPGKHVGRRDGKSFRLENKGGEG